MLTTTCQIIGGTCFQKINNKIIIWKIIIKSYLRKIIFKILFPVINSKLPWIQGKSRVVAGKKIIFGIFFLEFRFFFINFSNNLYLFIFENKYHHFADIKMPHFLAFTSKIEMTEWWYLFPEIKNKNKLNIDIKLKILTMILLISFFISCYCHGFTPGSRVIYYL